MKLEGKSIVITGASSGIGLSTTKLCLQEGASVLANYRSEPRELLELQETCGERLALCQADISVSSQVADLFRAARKWNRHFTGLVNNAGVLKDDLLLMTPEREYDRIVDTNLKGTFLCTQRAAKAMARGSGGSIVNLASIVGRFGNAGQSAYCASKAGVIGLTLSNAKELGASGIRVNAVAPGLVETPMISKLGNDRVEDMVGRTALGRLGQPSDVARAIVFLLSDDASFISGQVIGVDGGLAL
jgi:3-oxoacyl-[acyl-carrier protein] reductase